MRVVIHSWGFGLNHGQLLQALGLRYMVQKLGGLNEGEILGSYTNPADPKKELGDTLKSLTLAKYVLFKREWAKFASSTAAGKGDVHIYGSDHIWGGTGFYSLNEQMFGDIRNINIAYAPSAGNYVYSETEINRLRLQIKGFCSISVRDRATRLQIERMAGDKVKKFPIVCDPAFFLGDIVRKEIDDSSEITTNRVTVYANIKILPYSTEKYLEEKGLEVEYAGYSPRKRVLKRASILRGDLSISTSILYSFRRSKLVLTNTFHGCVMALMAERPFIAVVNENLRARLDSPLFDNVHRRRFMSVDEFGRLMRQPEEIDRFYDSNDIGWSSIEKEIGYSSEWLKGAIEKASRLAN